MIAANYTEFRLGLKRFLDSVDRDNETLVIHRGKEKSAVMMSLNEYNSMLETMHLLKSRKNADRLFESIRQMETGDVVVKNKID